MNVRLSRVLFALVPATLVGLVASTASAADNPCGNIELSAIGECHFEFEGGCTAKCEPLAFVASCDGECNASIDAGCTADCELDCSAECSVDPGSFDCKAGCSVDCEASASASCDSGDNECVAYAEAQCSAECEASCDVVPPSADCEAKCDGSCSASCEVEANFDCNIECTADLQGGCTASCDAPEGALFCDGQFINVTDIPACLEYLATNFSIEIEIDVAAEIESSCSVGAVGGTGDAKVGGAVGLMLAAAGLAAHRARRRRRNG